MSRTPFLFLKCPLAGLTAALLPWCAWAGQPPSTIGTVTIPAGWQEPAGPAGPLDVAALTQWWARLHNPVLDELIAGALRQSPDIRTAVSKISEARARRGVARAGLAPSLSAGATGSGTHTRDRPTGAVTQGESYTAALEASWDTDLFGQQRQTLAAASADLAQATENFHAAQVSLAAEVASAYVTLCSTEARLTVVENSVAAQAETAQIAQWREQAGLASALDTQQALSTLEEARASLPTLQQTLAQTRTQLAILCGRAPGELDALLARPHTLPAVPEALATGIPAETLRQRPDVRAAERGVAAAAARTQAAKRERLPSLTLTGSLGVESLRAGRLFSPETVTSSLLGSLTAPIFDAGRIRNNITIQTEVGRQALLAYESTVLTALAEVENAQAAVQRTAERLALLERATAAAREAALLAGQQYQAGQVGLLVVLDAQRTLLGLEEQRVLTAADRIDAHIQLYKTLGGGWSSL